MHRSDIARGGRSPAPAAGHGTPGPRPLLPPSPRRDRRVRGPLADADPSVTVPICPDWSLRELVAHLGRTQRWYAAGGPRNAGPPRGRGGGHGARVHRGPVSRSGRHGRMAGNAALASGTHAQAAAGGRAYCRPHAHSTPSRPRLRPVPAGPVRR
ncbi:maleylpyruvate isomerase N-terminal domain-containing protein [Streptomyces rimosus]|uniref:maleylpyruvate isomerase N-terminal domain-containing protein n=1 Tax=Streptomyces rimosus TaxID=1927 RepID=UPI00099C1B87|nr:maleylpyruvate isomerase N-terminal domain-containing protein [Streptomyces rimosus]